MTERKIIKRFNGGAENNFRFVEISIQKANCSICGHENVCITSDGSEGEYDVAYLCESCICLEMAKEKQ